MRIKNCRECGKIFNYITGPQVCPICREKLNEKFKEVKEFIRNTENPTITVVAEGCNVSERQILQWIKDERLELTDVSIAGVVCESCGMPITSGRYCEKCKYQILRDLSNATTKGHVAPKQENKEIARMRFLDRR